MIKKKKINWDHLSEIIPESVYKCIHKKKWIENVDELIKEILTELQSISV